MSEQALRPTATPTKVFVSYAHSSRDHKRTVADLVDALRVKGLVVLADTNVTPPQGPEEGWPKWMKHQMRQADWILIFIDEVYRRRFDGEEDPRTGLGATWEGAIITHQLYRESVKNTRFIPLLTDWGTTDLIPDELFGYTFWRIPKQTDELAAALRRSTRPVLPDSPHTGRRPNDRTHLHQIEVVLAIEFSKFDPKQQQKFVRAVAILLDIADVTIKSVHPGSVRVVIELPQDKAALLMDFARAGMIAGFGILSARLIDTLTGEVIRTLQPQPPANTPQPPQSTKEGFDLPRWRDLNTGTCVLLVEDNADYRLQEEGALQGAGYTTRWTDSTETAIRIIAQTEDIGLIIVTLDPLRELEYGPLHQEQGLVLLHHIRSSNRASIRNLPVIVTTSRLPENTESYAGVAMHAGANAFFEQPLDLVELVTLVRKLVPKPLPMP